jgi:hypothetical protein
MIALRLVILRDYQSAKCLVCNLTTSNLADDIETLGFWGTSMEDMLPVALNRRKPMTEGEREAYKDWPWKYSPSLDKVYPNYHPQLHMLFTLEPSINFYTDIITYDPDALIEMRAKVKAIFAAERAKGNNA